MSECDPNDEICRCMCDRYIAERDGLRAENERLRVENETFRKVIVNQDERAVRAEAEVDQQRKLALRVADENATLRTRLAERRSLLISDEVVERVASELYCGLDENIGLYHWEEIEDYKQERFRKGVRVALEAVWPSVVASSEGGHNFSAENLAAEGPKIDDDMGRRGVEALCPFVERWNLPLNPEHLEEMVFAVLAAFASKEGDSAA